MTEEDEAFNEIERRSVAKKEAVRAAISKEKAVNEIKVGDIVQINPYMELFGACFVVVTEVRSWGIQGYIQSAGVAGQQYIRLRLEEMEPTGGKAVWGVGEEE